MSTIAPAQRELITRKEVSDETTIAVSTLARWAAEGKGPKLLRVGSRVLYRRTDVIAWLDSMED